MLRYQKDIYILIAGSTFMKEALGRAGRRLSKGFNASYCFSRRNNRMILPDSIRLIKVSRCMMCWFLR